MFSVCIPVYNYNITSLIKKLSKQAELAIEDVEILVLDDGSSHLFRNINKEIFNLPNVKYIEQENNGRVYSRNKLAELANGDYLIFMDSDCDVPENYIQAYIENKLPTGVVVGGLIYPECPSEKEKWLRWKVGISREVRSLSDRLNNPYNSFLTSNFMISRNIMKNILFNSQLVGYGHEDTIFGLDLKMKAIPICHINNPVCHLGIDDVDVYLKKVEESNLNLKIIYHKQLATNEIKILRVYNKIKKFKLDVLVMALFFFSQRLVRYSLLSGCNSLLLLDFYKLGLLCKKD